MRTEKALSLSFLSLVLPSSTSKLSGDSAILGYVCKTEPSVSGIIRYPNLDQRQTFFYLNPQKRWRGSQQSLARHRSSQLSHASKSIINPIMREILMRCALESDFGVIIRAILPVVESWSWTEACSVAQSEGEKKCCYACRSCSHLCLNQRLYIICFFLVRVSSLTPLCLPSSTSPSDDLVWMMLWRLATFPGESVRKWRQLKEQRNTD